MHIDAFIDGRPAPGLGGAPHARISPIDGRSIVGTAASVSVAQVGEAVAAAMRAQRRWRSVPVADRVAMVRAAIDEAMPLLSGDMGGFRFDVVGSPLDGGS